MSTIMLHFTLVLIQAYYGLRYGHIAPKTQTGKVVTIFYAICGIPLMLLCLSNIGDVMASSFRFLYWKVCCYVCTRKPKKKRRHRHSNRQSLRQGRSRTGSTRRSARASNRESFPMSDRDQAQTHSDTECRYRNEPVKTTSLTSRPKAIAARGPSRYSDTNLEVPGMRNYAGYNRNEYQKRGQSQPPVTVSPSPRSSERRAQSAQRVPVLCNRYIMEDFGSDREDDMQRRRRERGDRYQGKFRQRSMPPEEYDPQFDLDFKGRARYDYPENRSKSLPRPNRNDSGYRSRSDSRPSQNLRHSYHDDDYYKPNRYRDRDDDDYPRRRSPVRIEGDRYYGSKERTARGKNFGRRRSIDDQDVATFQEPRRRGQIGRRISDDFNADDDYNNRRRDFGGVYDELEIANGRRSDRGRPFRHPLGSRSDPRDRRNPKDARDAKDIGDNKRDREFNKYLRNPERLSYDRNIYERDSITIANDIYDDEEDSEEKEQYISEAEIAQIRSKARRRERAAAAPAARIMSPMGFHVSRQAKIRDDYDTEFEDGYVGSKAQIKPVPIWLCVFLVVSYIIAGAFLFSQWEHWSFLDSAYFCFITLTTIGFGDFVPAQGVKTNSETSIALCSLYLLFGISLLAMSFNLVQEEVIANVKSVAKRLGIIKPEQGDESDDE